MSSDKDKPYTVGLSFFEGIGPLRYRALISYFGSAKAVFEASEYELRETGIGNAVIDNFVVFRTQVNTGELLKSYETKGVIIITLSDDLYPKKLKNLKDSPFVLYVLGNPKLLNEELSIAVVGTRKPTRYGIEVTHMITKGLVEQDCTIVSGMAMGIDAVAHKTALENNGNTIAVLGCGVDICYPAVNRNLYDAIIKRGAVISEFPPGKTTSRRVFPARNRIVAGLSLGVLVTEGAEKSGSLITPAYAAEYGRDVFTVPGPITSQMNKASMILLKNGAKPVESALDILEEYSKLATKTKQTKMISNLTSLTKREKEIVELIKQNGKLHIDELVRLTAIPESDLYPIISTLELKNIIKEYESGEYSLCI